MPNQQALKSRVYNFYKKKHEDGKHVGGFLGDA